MAALVSYELVDGIATITMDDGKANVLSVPMLQHLNAALDRAQSEAAVVVLSGRSRMFSGGFDLAVFSRDAAELIEMLQAGARLTERLMSFPLPVVAACTGHAVAMGAFLLLSADVRIGVDRDARIHINELKAGFTLPRFAIEVCRQRLAPAHVNHAIITAEPYSPAAALIAGFLDEMYPADALQEAVRCRAATLAESNPDAFSATKSRLRQPALGLLRKAIQQDAVEWKKLFLQ